MAAGHTNSDFADNFSNAWLHISPRNVVIESPIMAALSDAPVGAATGGVVSGLLGFGIPEIEAKRHEGKLKKGNYLIAVHADKANGSCKEYFQHRRHEIN